LESQVTGTGNSESKPKSSRRASSKSRAKSLLPAKNRHGNEREECLRRHKLTPELLKGLRIITPILKQATGGVKACVEALRGDDSADTLLFLDAYDNISDRDKKILRVEEICVIAGITPRRFIELVTGAFVEAANDASTLIVASAKPKIVEKMVKVAKTTLGEKDRENFLRGKQVDWFIQPKGLTIDNSAKMLTVNGGSGGEGERSPCRPQPPTPSSSTSPPQ
jgi:hypothetical protein